MFRRIEDIILTNQVNLKEMKAPEKCKLGAASFGARSLLAASSELAATSSGACLLRARSLLAASSKLAAASSGARSLLAASSELGACLLRAQSLL